MVLEKLFKMIFVEDSMSWAHSSTLLCFVWHFKKTATWEQISDIQGFKKHQRKSSLKLSFPNKGMSLVYRVCEKKSKNFNAYETKVINERE